MRRPIEVEHSIRRMHRNNDMRAEAFYFFMQPAAFRLRKRKLARKAARIAAGLAHLIVQRLMLPVGSREIAVQIDAVCIHTLGLTANRPSGLTTGAIFHSKERAGGLCRNSVHLKFNGCCCQFVAVDATQQHTHRLCHTIFFAREYGARE
jgi:hypothetical protein